MSRKKKIVVLHPSLVMGGAEKVLINMLNALDYNRVEVTLWLLESGGVLEKELTDNVKIQYVDYNKYFPENSWRKLIKFRLKHFKLLSVFRILFFQLLCFATRSSELKNIFKLKEYQLIDKNKYDLFVGNHCYRQDLLYWGFTQFKTKKRVIWVHGEDYLKPEPDLRRYAYNRYDCIFPVSEGLKKYFINLYPELNNKIKVFYNIQDIDGTISKSCEQCDCVMIHPAIVTVGRISPEKGMDRIPDCMKMLLESGYDVHWYIVGDGCERENIESECKSIGVSENIHFLGEKQNPYPYMKNADIYAQPSRREGYCTTTFEAKVLKKPIVVTDVSGMREQFTDGKTAIITKDQTPAEIAKAIKSLLDSPELCRSLVNNISADYPDNGKSLKMLYELLN